MTNTDNNFGDEAGVVGQVFAIVALPNGGGQDGKPVTPVLSLHDETVGYADGLPEGAAGTTVQGTQDTPKPGFNPYLA